MLSAVLGLSALAVMFGVAWPTCSLIWSFDHLEQHAKRRITGLELQLWATNLIAHHSAGLVKVSELGTNFPQQLLGLYHRPPDIMIYEPLTNDLGQIQPAFVTLFWGCGMIGHCGFEIGPTNFSGYRATKAWQGGVYFWKD